VATFEGDSAKVVEVVEIDNALWLTAATTKLSVLLTEDA
jgi:hypothetical protein